MTSKNKILVLIPTLQCGGAERVMVNLLKHLSRSHFQLVLGVLDMSEAVYRDEVPSDVVIVDLGRPRVLYALPGIAALIRRQKPSVVFSTLSHLNLALSMLRPLLPKNMRFIARETSIISEVIREYQRPALWRWAYRSFYRLFDIVVCQSQYMRDDLVARMSFPAEKAVVIHNPLDIERIRKLAAEPIPASFEPMDGKTGAAPIQLVSAGRLEHIKGFDLLITALSLCENPKLRLTILGDGPLRAELTRLCMEKGVMQQVCFAGYQKNPYPFFARADAFVLSSRYEGFPNVVLEALACGTPVVATPALGGTREMLRSMPACELADSISAPALANAIQRWLTGGRAAISDETVRPYAAERIALQYEELLLRLIGPSVTRT